MNARWLWMALVPLALVPLAMPAIVARGEVKQSSQRAANEPTRVLASVGDVLITQADVDLSLGRAGVAKADLPPLPQHMLMAAVDIVANQRRAMETLKKSNKSVSDAEIDTWLVENSPPDLKLTADQALAARAKAAEVSQANYRAFLAFRLSWPRYLQSVATEANLEKHYANQRSRFDGTRFQVEHIWLPAPPGESKTRSQAHERLVTLRKKLADGQLDFVSAGNEIAGEEGAKLAAPQWITGSGPLMPAIVDRVLETPAGDISPTFDSSQAVHVVRVIAVQPGERSFAEAKEDVRKHMLLFLLEFLAKSAAKDMPLVWQAS